VDQFNYYILKWPQNTITIVLVYFEVGPISFSYSLRPFLQEWFTKFLCIEKSCWSDKFVKKVCDCQKKKKVC